MYILSHIIILHEANTWKKIYGCVDISFFVLFTTQALIPQWR